MNETLLQVEGLVKHFRTRGGVVRAVDGVTLQIARGETLGLVGESGCGKSTLGRLILHLIPADSGHIALDGLEVMRHELQLFRRRVQIVFQDPYRSLNPRRTVGDAIAEPLLIHGLVDPGTVRSHVAQLLQEVGLDPAALDRFPHQFSGGQRQRIGIARALAVQPELIVLDEPVSALDVSVQAQIVHLLQQLQGQRGLSYLFISHNLGVVRHIADRVAVMYLGKIVELSPVRELYTTPRHPYTRALLDAVPEPDPAQPMQAQLRGDAPDPIQVPSGCRFHPRCQLARQVALETLGVKDGTAGGRGDGLIVPDVCRRDEPALREITPQHFAACHFAERLSSAAPPEVATASQSQ
ncbi:MAG: ABC transporter ATP-binding protein [Armatimonadota bacterium]|nr:ABC transporter ATP-binding protein [Armatimonadota bacterium]